MSIELKAVLSELQFLKSQLSSLQESSRMELLTINEVADVLKFTRKHIYSMIKNGDFPRQIKIGTSSRWKKADLEAWINQKTEATIQ